MLRVRSISRLCARIWRDACAPFFSYHIHLDVPWFVVVHRLLFRMPEGNQRAPERSRACFLATYFLHCTSYTIAFVNFLHSERAMIPSCFFHCQNVRTRMSACTLATYSPSQISWLTSRLVPRSASESISSSSCGYASHTAWRFRCERGFQQHQTRRPKTLQPTLQSCCEFEPSDTVHISSCYDVAALFQKVTEFRRVWPRTKPFPLRVGVVYIAALQQIIFNADIKVDQHRSYHPLEN